MHFCDVAHIYPGYFCSLSESRVRYSLYQPLLPKAIVAEDNRRDKFVVPILGNRCNLDRQTVTMKKLIILCFLFFLSSGSHSALTDVLRSQVQNKILPILVAKTPLLAQAIINQVLNFMDAFGTDEAVYFNAGAYDLRIDYIQKGDSVSVSSLFYYKGDGSVVLNPHQ